MKKLMMFICIIVFNLNLYSLVYAEGDPVKGKENFKICAACHGQNGEGNKALNAPAVGGQNEMYVLRQLKNFRAGIRGADSKDTFGIQMRPMALSLPDDQAVEDVAAYVATLDFTVTEPTIKGDSVAGKKFYQPCIACHGEKGRGSISLNAPRLARQHDWYIVRQIQIFKSGIRGAHNKDIYGAQMRPMAQLLATDEQINDLAAYLSTLK